MNMSPPLCFNNTVAADLPDRPSVRLDKYRAETEIVVCLFGSERQGSVTGYLRRS